MLLDHQFNLIKYKTPGSVHICYFKLMYVLLWKYCQALVWWWIAVLYIVE